MPLPKQRSPRQVDPPPEGDPGGRLTEPDPDAPWPVWWSWSIQAWWARLRGEEGRSLAELREAWRRRRTKRYGGEQ